ncbi:DNA alkylation repair protein [Dokdonia sp.]
MRLITRKSDVRIRLEECILAYDRDGLIACCDTVYKTLLLHKVKFPLLEFCGTQLYDTLLEIDQIPFCDQIQALKTEGGNVILGIMLQKRLEHHYDQSIQRATQYIADADIWYVCDIIGERVWGVSLLQTPEKTISVIEKKTHHESNWVIRSLGAGIHYAIKKGLPKEHVKTLFDLLLTCANTNDKEIRQGIGWAAKTTAKFHPDIIRFRESELNNTQDVAAWFRKKVEIGLQRHQYAKRN